LVVTHAVVVAVVFTAFAFIWLPVAIFIQAIVASRTKVYAIAATVVVAIVIWIEWTQVAVVGNAVSIAVFARAFITAVGDSVAIAVDAVIESFAPVLLVAYAVAVAVVFGVAWT